MIVGLELVVKTTITNLKFFGDLELAIKQLLGEYTAPQSEISP